MQEQWLLTMFFFSNPSSQIICKLFEPYLCKHAINIVLLRVVLILPFEIIVIKESEVLWRFQITRILYSVSL